MTSLTTTEEKLPYFNTMLVRRPKPSEHPLTLDVRWKNTTPAVLADVARRWQTAVDTIGVVGMFGMTEEQEKLVNDFWSLFDPACIRDDIPPANEDDKVEVRRAYGAVAPVSAPQLTDDEVAAFLDDFTYHAQG
ncbi:hypothetical protein EVB87_107 [Rhizobium phage RHph_N28_1]|nr:hypothetical protein EVB87_107 [Rhizobium phage RHph_N28_1]QIG74135.1 hypothetical protein EVC07_107 [Rhizobium phage RHph_N42]QXV73794.1 hypothetical protein [Rhizobium phage RHph_N46]